MSYNITFNGVNMTVPGAYASYPPPCQETMDIANHCRDNKLTPLINIPYNFINTIYRLNLTNG